MSIGKLAVGQQQYYLDAVAAQEDYYTASGEVPGRWLGSGCAELGVAGQVAPVDLHAVLSGLDPATLEPMGAANRRRPGFDLTFSPPKSVSVLYALGGEEVAASVVAGHDAAVDAAVAYLERTAAWGRTGHDGLVRVATSGFVAAAFRHRTSRAGDPQVHTHVLVANLAHRADGRWGALDARALYHQAGCAGHLYRAVLRHELTTRLGVAWAEPIRGLAELAGIPSRVLRAFSRRRMEVVAAMVEAGVTSPRAAQVATLATRKAKQPAV